MKQPVERAKQPLAGQVALVTGGAKRIGAAIVERLATAGADAVIHHATSEREAKALATKLKKTGHKAWTLQADLAKKAGRAGLVAAAAHLAGKPVTLLVNNASTLPEAKLAALDLDHVQANVELNAWAPFELTRAVAAQLPARKTGAVVNLIDARIADYDWDHVGYWLAKRMLWDLTRLSAVEFAPRLTVNAVAPGPVLGVEGDTEFPKRLAKYVPLRRTPTVEEVADAVVALLAARSTTGQLWNVDGGRHLGRAVYD